MSWLRNLVVKITGDKSGLDKGLKEATSSLDRFKSTVKKIGVAIGVAFSVKAIAEFGKNIVNIAAEAEGVATAFERLNSPGLLDDLRKATKGTVSDLELMKKAVLAHNFRIPLSELATYFEFARKRAMQTGESVDYLVNSIVTGIGRKSIMILDNLGISISELQEEVKKTGDFAVGAGNVIKRGLEEMGDVADTTATKIQSIKGAFENLKLSLGKSLTSTPAFQSLIQWVSDIAEMLNDPRLTFGQKMIASPNEYKKWQDEQFMLRQRYRGTFSVYSDEQIETLAKLYKNATGASKEYYEQLKLEVQERTENAARIKAEADALRQLAEEKAKLLQEQWSEARGKNLGKGLSPVTGPGMPGGISGLMNLEGIQQGEIYINKMTEALDWQYKAVNDLTNAFEDMFSNVSEGFDAMVDSLIRSLGRWIAELMARAAVLALLNMIAPGSSMAVMAHQSLGQMVPLGGGGIFSNNRLEFKIHGRDLITAIGRNE